MPVTIGGSGPITGVTSINTSVSDTELGYLDGVTSALQTQINAKADTSSLGLSFITSASLSGASVSINNCFSSLYANYLLLMDFTLSGTAYVYYRMRASGSDDTSTNYIRQELDIGSTTVTAARGSSATNGFLSYGGAYRSAVRSTIYNPQLALATVTQSDTVYSPTSPSMIYEYGFHNVNTAYDGITLYPGSSQTFSAGTVRIYGLRNS